MKKYPNLGLITAGFAAGAVAGLFGGGGGMLLVPLLTALTYTEDSAVFPTSLSIMLPVCVVSVTASAIHSALPWKEALPYLLGSGMGGLLAGIFGKRIPVLWLHRLLGILILWGGIRYLC